MNCADQLDNYPKDLFSDSLQKTITETKVLFKKYEEYIDKPMVKCCVLGNTSSGKSTLINVMLEREILYEGEPEGTLCVAKCQSSSNNEEYFELFCGNVSSNKHLPIKEIKIVNKTNNHYSKISMDLKNSLDIYLNAPNHWILKNFSLIDCPGFNVDNLDAIIKYCECADIIIFCFKAKASVTDKDIDKINRIKSKIGKFQICFIINRCDECYLIDRDAIIDKLSPLLTGEDAIYFISALDERKGVLNTKRHEEFELFKKCLQDQKSCATITYRKVYSDLLSSVEKLRDRLKFTNFRDGQFSDKIFEELRQEIIKLINNDTKKYYKNDVITALMEYSEKANKEILKYITKQLIRDCNFNDGIINDDYFYKRFIRNETIPKPIFSWYNFGDKNDEIKKSFVAYVMENSTIQGNIEGQYRETVRGFLKELGDYKEGIENIIKKIKETNF